MKTKSKIMLALLALFALFALVLGLLFSVPHAEAAIVEADIPSSPLEAFYLVGEKLQLPASVGLEYEGESYTGEYAETKMPDGKLCTAGAIELTSAGVYEARYAFSAGDKKLKAALTFSAVQKNWEMVSDQSSVTFGNVMTKDTIEREGLTVTIADGDTFRFNTPVDLGKGGLSEVITFYPNETDKKFEQRKNQLSSVNFDAEYIKVTLTDCYDPDIYVTGMIYYDPHCTNSIYCRTAAAGQGEFGLYLDCPIATQPSIYLDGLRYGLYEGKFGQSITSSGEPPVWYKWQFDCATNRIYLVESSGRSYLINDLDAPAVSSHAFPGFTTGEVYVSVTASDFYTSSTTVQIASIGNMGGGDLLADGYFDRTAPVVSVRTPNGANGIYIPKGREFALPDADAFDINLVGAVKKTVYFNYGTSTQSSVLVTDGKFTPVLRGTYTAEYRATDAFGNTGRAILPLYSLDGEVMTLEAEPVTELVAGTESGELAYRASSYNGNVNVKIEVVHENGDVYTVDGNTLTFTPLSPGKYTVVYTYSDGVETKTYSYDVACAPNPAFAFLGVPETFGYYIFGAEYDVPAFSAYSFAGERPAAVETFAAVSFDEGEFEPVGETFTAGGSVLRFRYTAGGSVYLSDLIPVVDVGYTDELRIEDYFVGEFSASKDYEHITFLSENKTGDAAMRFINRLSPALFSADFAIPASACSFDALCFVFYDCADPAHGATVRYETKNGGLFVSLDDGSGSSLNGKMNDGTTRYIRYSAESKAFYFSDNTETVSLPFEFGFASGYCMFEIRFERIRGDAGITLFRLQNQLMSDRTYDDFEPQIYCKESSGYAEIGSEAIAYGASVSDVLSPWMKSELRLRVTAPDGTPVRSKEGVLLDGISGSDDHAFTLEKYGRYMVEYTVRDASGNSAVQYYLINVADMIPPEVAFDDGSDANTVEEVRVGYQYSVKPFTVRDNYSAAEKLITVVFIYNDKGVLVSSKENTFAVTEEGMYTVYVYCIDEAGNYAAASYRIHATKEEK